jgi:uncharacterized protein with LGFP repeats
LTTRRSTVIDPLKKAKDYLVSQVKTYQRKLREAAEAEQRRLAEIARKEEEERRLAEAAQAEADGNIEEAEAIIQEEIYIPEPVVKIETPKVDNRKYATRPKARVVNKMSVIQAVAKNQALQGRYGQNNNLYTDWREQTSEEGGYNKNREWVYHHRN